jgi:hypothetical protein
MRKLEGFTRIPKLKVPECDSTHLPKRRKLSACSNSHLKNVGEKKENGRFTALQRGARQYLAQAGKPGEAANYNAPSHEYWRFVASQTLNFGIRVLHSRRVQKRHSWVYVKAKECR